MMAADKGKQRAADQDVSAESADVPAASTLPASATDATSAPSPNSVCIIAIGMAGSGATSVSIPAGSVLMPAMSRQDDADSSTDFVSAWRKETTLRIKSGSCSHESGI